MERDALLAHGTSFLLQDRLMNCSDYSTAWVCRRCGSLISLGFDELAGGESGEYCRICDGEGEEKGQAGKGEQVVLRGKAKGTGRKGLMDVIAVPCKSTLVPIATR